MRYVVECKHIEVVEADSAHEAAQMALPQLQERFKHARGLIMKVTRADGRPITQADRRLPDASQAAADLPPTVES